MLFRSVRWPPRGSVPDRAPSDGRAVNDGSIVLDLRWGDRRFLLMGDVEDDVDPTLLADGIGDAGRVDVLKVAHHGSATATSDPFIAATRPLVAIASAGSGNPYGHPAASTIARLEDAGATVLRTDADGSVTVSKRVTTGWAAPGSGSIANGTRCSGPSATISRRPPPRSAFAGSRIEALS